MELVPLESSVEEVVSRKDVSSECELFGRDIFRKYLRHKIVKWLFNESSVEWQGSLDGRTSSREWQRISS